MKTGLHLYVENADSVYERAMATGAPALRPPTDQFYGDREADIADPSGNQWYIEECERRMQAMGSGQ
jgi:PhnB protein